MRFNSRIKNGLFGMVGLTNGMIKGNVDSTYKTINDGNSRRSPSLYIKGGFDQIIAPDIRVRASGSFYHNGSSAASGLTLYGGDRTGSNYQNVMEKVPYGTTLPAGTSIAFSGRLNPGFTKKVDAMMLNAFIQLKGLDSSSLFCLITTSSLRLRTVISTTKPIT